MAPGEDDIDRLYQLPLDEFTPARNALAKQPGASVAIKTLQKPSVPAWAVNQLYWHRRKSYDRLMAAAEKRRDAHGRLLSGKPADVAAAEAAHADALKKAADDIRALLADAGDSATPATMVAVTETLQALPGDEAPGRLTRPLKPKGFEALAGLVPFGKAAFPAPAPTRPQPVPPPVTGRETKEDKAAAAKRAQMEKRAADEQRREVARLTDALRDARAAEREATTTLARTRDTRDRVERERADLTEQLEKLETRARALADDVYRQEREAARATSERERTELQLSLAKERKHT